MEREDRASGRWPCLKPLSLYLQLQRINSKKGVSVGVHTQRAEELSPLPGIWLSVLMLMMGGEGGGLFFRPNEVGNCSLFFRAPLHYAAANCHFHCIETLVTTGANVNETDDWGRTALHYAAASDMDRK